MNSDEPQKSFPDPEQEPTGSVESEQQLGQEATDQASDEGQEFSVADELPNQDFQGVTGEETANSQSVSAKPVEPREYLPKLELNNNNLEKETSKVEQTPSSAEADQGKTGSSLTQTVAELERQEKKLREKIASLQEIQANLLSEQLAKNQTLLEKMVQEGLTELEQRKQALQISVEQLERRRERIRQEMRSTFAGVSQDLAIRVQGFKDYLVGSLEDLVTTAEELELSPVLEISEKPPLQTEQTSLEKNQLQFAEQGFQEQARQIRNILDQYRNLPDYYGPSWQLRRTFEPIHAERVSNWFFSQGGRGPIRTMGSRLQNILVASAVISVLRTIEDENLRTLVLANTPERLGEWRRGLQDCLGISRSDFGPERGVVLFEEATALVQKADRLITRKQLPLIIIDETEDQISLSLLQFPLWLAFAPDPQKMSPYQY
ncbi:MAG: DUF3086 domain-containing protein [Coleofasciculaceae cyanobacterium]